MADPKTPQSSQRALAIAACVGAVLLVFLRTTHVGQVIESTLVRPIEFGFREAIDQSPPIDPRLKIIGFDDFTVSHHKLTELGLDDWQGVLSAISANQPRMIIIDKRFGMVSAPQAGIDQFVAEVKTGAPVAVGAFTRDTPVRGLPTLDTSRPYFQLDRFGGQARDVSAWPVSQRHPYGPYPGIAEAFSAIGHFNYDGDGEISPFQRLDEQSMMPHLALTAAHAITVADGQLNINGQDIPLTNRNRLIINFPKYRELTGSVKSMAPLIDRARRGRPYKLPDAGDTVLLLPLYYTGNVDMGQTPVGRMPRGLIVASIINSVLTGEWIAAPRWGDALTVAAALAGGAMGALLSALTFWLAAVVGILSILTVGLLSFGYAGVALPWAFAIFAYLGVGTVLFVHRQWHRDRSAKILETALRGFVPKPVLEQLKRNPEALNREASEELITVMFIDIAGFSTMAETMVPEDVFANLKTILTGFARLVHEHGGVVDKTLGDGMLCYFGYDYLGRETQGNQADQALDCAAAIINQHLNLALKQIADDQLAMPLRIGLNTARVFVGDIGEGERPDRTIIGEGVNFAQRLEQNCHPFKVMLAGATLEMSRFHEEHPAFESRVIKIKHHEDLYSVYEFDPVANRSEDITLVMEAYRQTRQLKRSFTRWPVQDPEMFRITTSRGLAKWSDVSRGGIALILPKYLSGGIDLEIHIDSLDGSLADELKAHDFGALKGIIRWGRPAGQEFLHGIEFVDLSTARQDQLSQILRDAVLRAKTPVPQAS